MAIMTNEEMLEQQNTVQAPAAIQAPVEQVEVKSEHIETPVVTETVVETPKVETETHVVAESIETIAVESNTVLESVIADVTETEKTDVVQTVVDTIVETPVVEEIKEISEPAVADVVVETKIATATVVETTVVDAVSTSNALSLHKCHAYSPMTKAPAPAVMASDFEIKEYQREPSTFESKGAGGHVAANVATSEMANQLVSNELDI